MDTANTGCPTAVLVDVSPPVGFHVNHDYASSNTDCFKEDELHGCKFMNIEKQVSKEKLDRISNPAHLCKTGVSHNATNICEIESQVSLKRSRWKTPSPQSMSCISKEASKVIDHLNSSSIFDEDLLLDEEVFPIPFSLDELDDDDDADQRDFSDNVLSNAVLDNESSRCVQLLNKTEKNSENLNCHSSKAVPIVQNDLKQTLLEKNLTKVNVRVSVKSDSTSKESFPCAVSSHGNSDSLICSDEVDDVFDVAQIAFEDKENMQDKKKKLIRKEIMGSKISSKTLAVNKSKVYQRGTLKNLSNIKPETSAKHISFTKNVTTPLRRMSISTNIRKIEPSTEKPLMKKTTLSQDSHYLKKHSLSNSFQFQNTKQLISSVKKSQPTIKIDFAHSSASSDVKQQNVFATPSKRYSICTPLKSASVIKPPVTPAITSLNTFAFTRYTPQPARPSHLSFSRSLQQSGNSQFLAAKGPKQEIYIPSSASKAAPDYSRRLSFSQSLSAVPLRSGNNIMSTSSKGRFSSKLNLSSPLTVNQDKKLVRALFTNVTEK